MNIRSLFPGDAAMLLAADQTLTLVGIGSIAEKLDTRDGRRLWQFDQGEHALDFLFCSPFMLRYQQRAHGRGKRGAALPTLLETERR